MKHQNTVEKAKDLGPETPNPREQSREQTGHTQGKWFACYGGEYIDYSYVDENGNERRGNLAKLTQRPCPERDANARLIAAAPELLEALKECVHALDAGFYIEPGSVTDQRIQAAIAHAEGR